MRTRTKSLKAGFTAVEVVIGALLLALLARALVETSGSMSRITSAGNIQTLLHDQGERAMRSIVTDLKLSGFASVGEKDYPYIFDGGEASDLFNEHVHVPANPHGEPNDADYGASREIVFLLPDDADGDSRPDFDVVNGVQWSNNEISYVVVTAADGQNYLERRTNGAAPRRIASGIERVVFDTPASCGYEIPLDSVRIRLFLRRTDDEGRVVRQETVVTVNLRNS